MINSCTFSAIVMQMDVVNEANYVCIDILVYCVLMHMTFILSHQHPKMMGGSGQFEVTVSCLRNICYIADRCFLHGQDGIERNFQRRSMNALMMGFY